MGKVLAVCISEKKEHRKKIFRRPILLKILALKRMPTQENGIAR